MCSERDLVGSIRERPVDPGICHCSLPKSIRVVVRRIQILSIDACITGGTRSGSIEAVENGSQRDAMAAWRRGYTQPAAEGACIA